MQAFLVFLENSMAAVAFAGRPRISVPMLVFAGRVTAKTPGSRWGKQSRHKINPEIVQAIRSNDLALNAGRHFMTFTKFQRESREAAALAVWHFIRQNGKFCDIEEAVRSAARATGRCN